VWFGGASPGKRGPRPGGQVVTLAARSRSHGFEHPSLMRDAQIDAVIALAIAAEPPRAGKLLGSR
jgi:hypothetical protein